MIFAAYGSVSDIEIVWTAVALIGGAFSIYNVRDAIKDVRALPTNVQNGRRIVAWASLRVEMARLTIQTIFAVIGFLAMLVPEVPDSTELPTAQAVAGAAFRMGLLLSGALLAYQSMENRRMRTLLLHPHLQTQSHPEGGKP